MNERHYGVASAEEMAGLSGREMLEAMIQGRLPAPPMSRTLGFRLVEVGDGLAVFEGEPGADLLNPLGTVHGGWALTLIDSAAGCAAHTRLPAGVGYTTVETKVNMTRAIAADTGTIRAEGRVVAEGRRIVTTEARMLDGKGRILAHGTSTIMVLHPR
ncbi:PaaI family thioesterase [Allosphingosinicella humi]